MSCCDFDAFYRDEGIMTPRHECPRPAPLSMDDFEADMERPLTDLEQELLQSLNFGIGVAEGRVIDRRRRWT